MRLKPHQRRPLGLVLTTAAVLSMLAAPLVSAEIVPPSGGQVVTATGIAGSGCVNNGFDYTPVGSDIAVSSHCFATTDDSTVARLATVNNAKTQADLTAVYQSSPFKPGAYFAQGTMATRLIKDAPLAADSEEIAEMVPGLPARYVTDPFKSWLNTSINIGPSMDANGNTVNSLGGLENIPIYTVDSSNPFQTYADFSSTDARVVNFPKLAEITIGSVPIPTWALPSPGGDRSLAILDKGTGILRAYFNVTKQSNTAYQFAASAYLYTNGQTLGVDNYWMSYIQGSSSVVGLANELTQIGADEVVAGQINHMVSVTFPSSKANVISFPAKQADGRLGDAAAPAEGQVFRLPASLDIDAMELSPLEKMIAKAVQKYGGIVTDQNFWTMAFNAESPLAKGPGAVNPWAPGGAAHQAVGGDYDLNSFPWSQTEWMPVHYAGHLTQGGGGDPNPDPDGQVVTVPSYRLFKATIPAGKYQKVTVAGRGGVPKKNVTSVVLKLVAYKAKGEGDLVAYQSGAAVPAQPTLRYLKNANVEATVTVPMGTDGKIRVKNLGKYKVQVAVYVQGYTPATT